MQIAFVLDIIIAVLLILTITYAVRLNQRLSQLRKDKNELQKLAVTFAEATTKAENGIQQLKISSEALRKDVKSAEILRDDLKYLLERGGRTADEMVAAAKSPHRAPGGRGDDGVGEDDDLLIQEAIRAASSATGGGPKPAKQQRAGLAGLLRKSKAPREDEPKTAPFAPNNDFLAPEPRMGGGLGGLNPDDRLVGAGDDERADEDDAHSIGDTDAARELLKALSTMK